MRDKTSFLSSYFLDVTGAPTPLTESGAVLELQSEAS